MVWLRRISWFLTAAYWALLCTLTHLPPEEIAKAPQFWDKAEHGLAYFLLSVLLGASLMFTFPERRTIPLWVLTIGLVYGALDEIFQPLVRRDAELLDWVADACGVWSAVVILWLLQRRFIPKREAREPSGFPIVPPSAVESLPAEAES
jgi:VanZ family protein